MKTEMTINECYNLLFHNDQFSAGDLSGFLADDLHSVWLSGDEACIAHDGTEDSPQQMVCYLTRSKKLFVIAHTSKAYENFKGTGEFTVVQVQHVEGRKVQDAPAEDIMQLGFFNDEGEAVAAFVHAIRTSK